MTEGTSFSNLELHDWGGGGLATSLSRFERTLSLLTPLRQILKKEQEREDIYVTYSEEMGYDDVIFFRFM
jgi:hypothetical protein